MSKSDVTLLLGESHETETVDAGDRWTYHVVRQRESVTRIFGLIPIRSRAKPEETTVTVQFHADHVASTALLGVPYACGEFGRPPVLQ